MANILIVEDDRTSARLLSLLLKKGGHSVTEVNTIEAARQQIFDWPEFALMILDNRLRNRYGWELLQDLRKHFYLKGLPVLVYTAAGDRNSVSRYVQLGVQNIRTKPYSWDVLSVEIEKAEKAAWNIDDFVPARQVMERLQVTEAEYYAGLEEVENQLQEASESLLTLLSPSKEDAFLERVEELRSKSSNYGVQIVQLTLKEIVSTFREEDWVESVAAVRMLNMIARRIGQRREEYLAGQQTVAVPEPLDPAEVGSLDGVKAEAGAMPTVQVRHHADVPAGFRELARSFAQSETVSHLVQRAVHGNVRESRWAGNRTPLGRGLHWLCYLEPGESGSVARAIRRVDGLESAIREYPVGIAKEPDRSLEDFVANWGVFPAGAVTLVFSWLSQLKAVDFPLQMQSLATRQLVCSQLARMIASRIQRPVNLEATVALECVGEWLFALRFPGVYSMVLLEETTDVTQRYRPAYETSLRPLVSELQLPREFLDVWRTRDLAQFRGEGSVRLALGIRALAMAICEAYELSQAGRSLDDNRLAFMQSPAWELLAAESLKLPDDRERFFERLLQMVAALYPRSEQLFKAVEDGRLRTELSSPAAGAAG